MTKIRPQRLAEIERTIFRNSPSLAYAKGFLLIYGKFLDVESRLTWTRLRIRERDRGRHSYSRRTSARNGLPRRWFGAVPAATGGTGGSNRVSPCRSLSDRGSCVGFLGMKFFSQCAEARAWARGTRARQPSATATPAVASDGSSQTAAPNIGAVATTAPVSSSVPAVGPPETAQGFGC